jgi:hypothetical protein
MLIKIDDTVTPVLHDASAEQYHVTYNGQTTAAPTPEGLIEKLKSKGHHVEQYSQP